MWDKILRVTLKAQGVWDTLQCEPGKKEVRTPNVVLVSELRVSRVTYGSEDSGDLSLRDACFGKPRSMNKRSFTPSNVDSRCKGNSEKGMEGGRKESPLCCIDGHPPHPKVRVHPGECSQEQPQVWNLPRWSSCSQAARWFFEMTTLTWIVRNISNRHTIEEITEEINEAGIRVEKSKIVTIINKMVDDSDQWKVARTSSKSLSAPECLTLILIRRELRVTAHHSAKGGELR